MVYCLVACLCHVHTFTLSGVGCTPSLFSGVGYTPSRFLVQCSNEMLQILRLARRDGDEWVRLFASVLAPFPHSQTINSEQITEGVLEDLQEKIRNSCEGTVSTMIGGGSSMDVWIACFPIIVSGAFSLS